MYAATNKPVIVVAPSNVLADELTDRLSTMAESFGVPPHQIRRLSAMTVTHGSENIPLVSFRLASSDLTSGLSTTVSILFLSRLKKRTDGWIEACDSEGEGLAKPLRLRNYFSAIAQQTGAEDTRTRRFLVACPRVLDQVMHHWGPCDVAAALALIAANVGRFGHRGNRTKDNPGVLIP